MTDRVFIAFSLINTGKFAALLLETIFSKVYQINLFCHLEFSCYESEILVYSLSM